MKFTLSVQAMRELPTANAVTFMERLRWSKEIHMVFSLTFPFAMMKHLSAQVSRLETN